MSVSSSSTSLTPMLKQYLEIKEQSQDAILFYRIGDFYEMFYDDAIKASKILDIVLTSRNKNDPNPVPLCGVPYHSCQSYIEKLIEYGCKVAICEQVEDSPVESIPTQSIKESKGIVRREITRVLTPALSGFLSATEKTTSSQSSQHTLVACFPKSKDFWGMAAFDINTGDFKITEALGMDEIREISERWNPQEVLFPEKLKQESSSLGSCLGPWSGILPASKACLTFLPDWVWDESYARKILYRQFGVVSLSGFHCEENPTAVIAAGAILHYVRETQKVDRLIHLTRLRREEKNDRMLLSEDSRQNLALEELVDHVNRTRTSLGKRMLREWYHAPLISVQKINERLDAVEELLGQKSLVEKIQSLLDPIYDLERINGRLSLGTANARDLKALSISLESLEKIVNPLSEFHSPALKNIFQEWNFFKELGEKLKTHLVENPPFSLKEGGLIEERVDTTLDELRQLQRDAKGAIAAIEDREKKRTGINSLKIQFNRVFGYYLEVSAANLSKVPPDFIRKQTLSNAERFITPELKEFENKILGAEEKIKHLEYEIFCKLRDAALQEVGELQKQASRVAALDSFLSLATYARERPHVRPVISEKSFLRIKAGRHPLVEKNVPAGSYVPNDLVMESESRFLMITGPNMAGKSTVIRQAGVIVLMAQVGTFVPADEATVGVVDKLFTRVGAADRLARGESTFMVEMCETAAILHQATEKSLVLLDEIGRGTSTFDGISIAWAVAEYLHDQIQARTLFATHYHELIDLEKTRTGIKNYNVQVKEENGEVTFLYRLVPGGMSHSYGIHVAKLAGVPAMVLERAKEVLKNLEESELEVEGSPRIAKKHLKKDVGQFGLF